MDAGDSPQEGHRRRSVALKVLGVAALIALAVVASKLAFRGPAPGSVTGDTLAIRLVGVRPDGGDAVYDAAGARLGEELGPASGAETWKTSELCRQFIFDLPSTGQELLFLGARLSAAPEGVDIGGTTVTEQLERAGRRRLYLDAILARSRSRQWFHLLRVDVAVERVDVTLSYFVGPRGPAAVTFIGPFEPGVDVRAEGTRVATLTPDARQPVHLSPRTVRLHVSAGRRVDPEEAALLYDAAGGRHLMRNEGNMEYSCSGVSLSRVAAVTFGETPRERTFHSIRVAYPGLPRRTHCAYLDEVAERIGAPAVWPARPGGTAWGSVFSLKGPDDALRVIDVARGRLIVLATGALGIGRFDRDELDVATQERVRRAALSWLDAFDPAIRAAGAEVGLRYGWHEFVAPALELARTGDAGTRGRMSRDLGWSTGVLEAGDFPPIADLLLTEADGVSCSGLLECLRTHARERAAGDELLRLAGSDRPWLWWPAIQWLSMYGPPAWDALLERARDSEPMHMRVIQTVGPGQVGGESLSMLQAAYDGLSGLLSPGVIQADPGLFFDLLHRMDTNADHRAAADGVVGFLRRQLDEWDLPVEDDHGAAPWWAVDRCVKYLNRWYGKDIGGLGSDVKRQSDENAVRDWRQVASEAVAWYADAGPPLPPAQEPASAPRAVLSNGTIVELLALGDYPSEGARWWRPDGTPLPGPPVPRPEWLRSNESAGGLPEGRPIQLVLKLSNWGLAASREYLKLDRGTWMMDKGFGTRLDEASLDVSVFVVPPGTASCTASISLYPDAWTTLVESDGTREVRGALPEGEAVLGAAQAAEDEVSITATTTVSAGQYTLLAVRHTPLPRTSRREQSFSQMRVHRTPSGGAELQATFRDLRPEDVECYRVKARPLRRVVFENVSLEPGRKAQVEVSGEGSETAASEHWQGS